MHHRISVVSVKEFRNVLLQFELKVHRLPAKQYTNVIIANNAIQRTGYNRDLIWHLPKSTPSIRTFAHENSNLVLEVEHVYKCKKLKNRTKKVPIVITLSVIASY